MPQGFTVWFTGLSGAGKTTVANRLASVLRERGVGVEVLDGDVVRTNLSKGVGFSKEDRDTNIRRIGFVAQLLSRHGVAAIVAAISPYREIRDEVREAVTDDGTAFVEVYAKCSIDELLRRDVKGLYEKAVRGEIPNFTGVSDPYEEPVSAEVVFDSELEEEGESLARVLAHLEATGLVPDLAEVSG